MDKKVTVGYYLNKRMKVLTHQGKDHYPLYARIAFLRKNSSIKVQDYNGDAIYMNEDDFEFNFKTLAEPPYHSGLSVVLNKEKIIRSAIEYEYEKVGDKFVIGDFVKRFRAYELYLFKLLEERLYQELDAFYKDHLDINQYQQAFSQPQLEAVVLMLEKAGRLDVRQWPEKIINLFGAYLAIYSFSFQTRASLQPNYRGSFFGWMIKSDSRAFRDYCSQFNDRILFPQGPPAVARVSGEIESIPVVEKVEVYTQVIDKECLSVGFQEM